MVVVGKGKSRNVDVQFPGTTSGSPGKQSSGPIDIGNPPVDLGGNKWRFGLKGLNAGSGTFSVWATVAGVIFTFGDSVVVDDGPPTPAEIGYGPES